MRGTGRRPRLANSRPTELKEEPMRGAGRVVFAATLLLIVGTLNIIYGIGALDDANIFVNDNEVHPHQPQHHGLGPDHPGDHPAHRRLFADCRQHLRPLDRNHRRQPRRDRSPAARSAAPTRGGRLASSRCASTSSTDSSCSARTRRQRESELTAPLASWRRGCGAGRRSPPLTPAQARRRCSPERWPSRSPSTLPTG